MGLPAKLGADHLGTLGYVRLGRLRRDFAVFAGHGIAWSNGEPGRTNALPLPAGRARVRRFEPRADLERESEPRA